MKCRWKAGRVLPWWLREKLPLLQAAANGELAATYTTLLSPFDPLVWDRERARQFFNFDFSLECYLPAPKRVYGYYLLPVLHRGALVGRLDAKAHRPQRLFEVKSFYLDESVEPTPELAAEVGAAIRRCAAWHAAPEVRLEACRPASFAPLLAAALAELMSLMKVWNLQRRGAASSSPCSRFNFLFTAERVAQLP